MNHNLPPGWYANEDGVRKYWTGQDWITPAANESSPVTPAVTPSAPADPANSGDVAASVPPAVERRRPRRTKLLVGALGAVAALAVVGVGVGYVLTGRGPSLSDGWNLGIDSSVGSSSDRFEFDYSTLTLVEETSGVLSMADADLPSLSELRRQAAEERCQFVLTDYDSGDIDEYEVESLLYNTLRVASAGLDGPLDKYEEQMRAVAEETGSQLPPSPESPDVGIDDWEAAFDEWQTERDEWQTEYDALYVTTMRQMYPEIADDYTRSAETRQAAWDDLRKQVFSETMVQDAQEFIVKQCDIQMPAGYEYRTAAELGIELP